MPSAHPRRQSPPRPRRRHHGHVDPLGRALLAQGFRILAYGGDLWIYQRALRKALAELRKDGL